MAKKSIARTSIQNLISTVDIVSVIEAHVKLKKRGSNAHGLCPFHHEKTPSFSVNCTKQFFYCFGCHKGGNVIDFVMEYDKLNFPEAIEKIADTFGVALEYDDHPGHNNAVDVKPLFDIHSKVASGYEKHFNINQTAIQFAHDRGIHPDAAKVFRIGYAPKEPTRQYTFLKPLFDAKSLADSGIIGFSHGKPYDRFRHRIMFPIRDLQGRVIAFGGRSLDANQPAKYLNSPETPIFKKNKVVYGLYEVIQHNRQPDSLVIVEGYMDVISCHQAGFKNAVACLGTAFTINHLQLLARQTQHLIFCFDGDKAGYQASWKALQVCLQGVKDGFNVAFCHLPKGVDPDTLLQSEGHASLQAYLDRAEPLETFLFNHLKRKWDTSTVSGKSGFVKEAHSLIKPMHNNFTKQILLKNLRTWPDYL